MRRPRLRRRAARYARAARAARARRRSCIGVRAPRAERELGLRRSKLERVVADLAEAAARSRPRASAAARLPQHARGARLRADAAARRGRARARAGRPLPAPPPRRRHDRLRAPPGSTSRGRAVHALREHAGAARWTSRPARSGASCRARRAVLVAEHVDGPMASGGAATRDVAAGEPAAHGVRGIADARRRRDRPRRAAPPSSRRDVDDLRARATGAATSVVQPSTPTRPRAAPSRG